MEKIVYEIKDFCEKYLFKGTGDVKSVNYGWINTFKGIHLMSDEYSDSHYYFYFFGNKNTNLFKLIGKHFHVLVF